MINWFRRRLLVFLVNDINLLFFNTHDKLKNLVNDYRKENQSLSGRIKILEEQQEIMHNFLKEKEKMINS
jgi:hypothetical protein